MNLKIFSPKDFPAYLPKLNALYDDLFDGGKGFRSKLVQMVSTPLGLSLQTQQLLCQTIEFIHNASLLHDDLIDRSQLRRGKPAAWTKYTPEYAVLAGDYLLARVMVNLSSYGSIQLVQFTSETISDLLEGEWLQDSVVGDFFVSLDQLDRIHNLKTASLFKWCLRAPFMAASHEQRQLAASHEQKNGSQNLSRADAGFIDYGHAELHNILDQMGTLLGQLFQRSDDLLDYNIRNEEGKAILGDLKSGYLNSFGAFISKGMDRSQIDKMVKSTDLNDFYKCLSKDELSSEEGEKLFKEKVQEFDSTNEKMIQLYEHYLSELEKRVAKPELIKSLKPLTEILYWRRKPKS